MSIFIMSTVDNKIIKRLVGGHRSSHFESLHFFVVVGVEDGESERDDEGGGRAQARRDRYVGVNDRVEARDLVSPKIADVAAPFGNAALEREEAGSAHFESFRSRAGGPGRHRSHP